MSPKRCCAIGMSVTILSLGVTWWKPALAQAEKFATPAVAMPHILVKPCPPEAIEIWKLSEVDPARLVSYIRLPSKNADGTPMDRKRRQLLRYLATQRLGDMGDLEIATLLEQEAQLLEKEEGRGEAEAVRVAIERIHLRLEGTAVYLDTMKEWVKAPFSQGGSSFEFMKVLLRIIDGARALGVARQGEEVILDRYNNDQAFDNCYMGFWLARALARFESPRTLSALEKAVRLFVPYVQPATLPLEPGEPDVCVTYWNLRMQGLSQSQRIQYLIRAFREGWAEGALQMIEFEGQAAVPSLMEVVSQPPAPTINGRMARSSAAWLLGRLRARDAVPLLSERALDQSEDMAVRETCAFALGQTGDERAVLPLSRLTSEPRRGLVLSAISALGKLKDPRGEDALITNLKHGDPNVRSVAAETLRVFGSVKAIQALQEAIVSEKDENARKTMEASIRIIGRQRQ